MTKETALATQDTSMSMVMGADLNKVVEQLQAIANFQAVVQNNLKNGQDYGVIPGTNKPTLLKPGAEKIQMLFGVTSEYEEIERIQDYEKGFFAYTIKCTLSKNGTKITEGLGHCNTKEKKYSYKGSDPFTLANTCLKMAKKRAQVDATLTIASLSEVFTQDIEDFQEFSNREQLETMNDNDAGSMKITFGKFKGKTVQEVYEQDKSYLEWIEKNAKQEALKKAASLVLSGTKSNKENNPKELMSENQRKAIFAKAEIIGKANNMSADEVISAYKVGEVSKLEKDKASSLIDRLDQKVKELENNQKSEEITDDDFNALFDVNKPPFEGDDIKQDDLPF